VSSRELVELIKAQQQKQNQKQQKSALRLIRTPILTYVIFRFHCPAMYDGDINHKAIPSMLCHPK
jgi:hypothetical protein